MPQVKVDGLGVVDFPDGTPADQMSRAIRMHLSQVQPQASTIQNAVPQDAGMRAQSWTDKLRQAKDHIGRIIAPFVGLNFDQMADDESKGILRQMLVFHGSRNFAEMLEKQRGAEGLQAAVRGDSGNIHTGSWHGEAINRAHYLGDFSPQAEGELPESRQGFLTKDGRFLTRDEADKEFGVKFSEDIPHTQE